MPNYTVAPGDTLSLIASRNGIDISDMTITTGTGTIDLSQPNYGGFNVNQIDVGNQVSWELKPISPDAGDDAEKNADDPVKGCVGNLKIILVYGNDIEAEPPYRKDSKVLIGGKIKVFINGIDKDNMNVTSSKITENGEVTFKELKCGKYKVTASYEDKFDLVEKALSFAGSERWKAESKTTSFDGKVNYKNTYKCNLFVYDMIQQTYGTAPTYTYERLNGWVFDRTVPDLAGSWADNDNSEADPTEGWENIDYQHEKTPVYPGSILGIRANYQNASGHVAIIAYPEESDGEFTVVGSTSTAGHLIMQGKTVSAGTNTVKHNYWGFRTRDKSGSIASLNSPSAGIEIKK